MLPGRDRTAGDTHTQLRANARSDGDADVLLLGVKVNGVGSALAADARLLEPAKGHPEVALEPAVDPDGPGLDRVGDSVRPLHVVGPDRAGKAVLDAVGVGNHLPKEGKGGGQGCGWIAERVVGGEWGVGVVTNQKGGGEGIEHTHLLFRGKRDNGHDWTKDLFLTRAAGGVET